MQSVQQNKIFVSNLPYSVTEAELREFFQEYNLTENEGVVIPVDRYTGKSRGFAFITCSTQKDAQNALSLDGVEFQGRNLVVRMAKSQTTTGGSGGRTGGPGGDRRRTGGNGGGGRGSYSGGGNGGSSYYGRDR